jgi:hypothetical protein
MTFPRFACAALLSALLTFGCAAGPDLAGHAPVPEEQWAGQLNARDAQHHAGTYILTLSPSPGGLVGEYRLESDRCLTHGRVRASRQGAELHAEVIGGENRMEIRAALSGESLFGTYRFTSGPCQGDWGSTVAQRKATPH